MPQVADETRQVVAQFWAAMQANDWVAAAALFADGYLLEWPQSGERIVGRTNFVAINANYPATGRWQFTVERVVVEDELAVTAVAVTDGAVNAQVITFSSVRGGQIVHQVEYWPDPFDAPAWRAAWVARPLA